MHGTSLLSESLIYLSAAVLAVPISKFFGLGSVLGYLAAGAVIGPWGIRLIADASNASHLSEFGVVFLLFVIGLELKPSRLWSLRKAVFGLGTAQVFGSALLLGGILWLMGVSPLAAGIAGIGLSLSSTAFAMQLLSEKNQVNSTFGQTAFAILLFQDLAVIPLLAALPLLSPLPQTGHMAHPVVVLAVILAIPLGGRYLLRPVFRVIAETRTKEIFTAASLLLVLGISALMNAIGLSMALGAFLAGVVLAESEYRHELEADIEPFKGLLLGLFFISVGMTVDFGLLGTRFLDVLLGVLGLLILKGIVLFGLGKAAKLGTASSLQMAVLISQGGEFAFVLFSLCTTAGILPSDLAALLVLIVTLSMALTPVLVAAHERWLVPRFQPAKPPYEEMPNQENPVLIAGYGRVGQIPARVLRLEEFTYTALEHDPEHVGRVMKYGNKIFYGDASRIDLLEAAGAKHAKVFILAIDDMEASVRTAEIVRKHFPHLNVFARARNREHAHRLMDLGIIHIYRETFGTSLELSRDVLRALGFTLEEAEESVRCFRMHDEKMLVEQHALRHDEEALINFSKRTNEQLLELFREDKAKHEKPT